MEGKVCLVTGANAGIGAVTARALAERGATVVVVGRSLDRCEATVGKIRHETGNRAVETLLADLSSQSDVRRLAREFLDRHPRLDVLVNNAGAAFTKQQESADGIEMTFALNHLAYFLLTNLLLDTLRVSAPSRIVNVASDAHRMAAQGLPFDDLRSPSQYRGFRSYAHSKLANILFTFELARRLEGTGVTANALHPGFVASSFFEDNGWRGAIIGAAAKLVAISPEAGAKTSIYLATAPEVEGISGRYFVKQKDVEPSPAARDEAAAKRLWELSEALTRSPAVQPQGD